MKKGKSAKTLKEDENYVEGQDIDVKPKGRPTSTPKNTNLTRRRQVHVRCEHRRRKEIQEALESLEAELPVAPKPRSKGTIIVDSAEMIKELTFTLDRLLNENQMLLNRVQVNELTK